MIVVGDVVNREYKAASDVADVCVHIFLKQHFPLPRQKKEGTSQAIL